MAAHLGGWLKFAIDAAIALLDAARVPRQVEVEQIRTMRLEVQALSGCAVASRMRNGSFAGSVLNLRWISLRFALLVRPSITRCAHRAVGTLSRLFEHCLQVALCALAIFREDQDAAVIPSGAVPFTRLPNGAISGHMHSRIQSIKRRIFASGRRSIEVMVRPAPRRHREVRVGFRSDKWCASSPRLPDDAPDLVLSRLLDEYRTAREERFAKPPPGAGAADCSSSSAAASPVAIEAFARSLKATGPTTQRQWKGTGSGCRHRTV